MHNTIKTFAINTFKTRFKFEASIFSCFRRHGSYYITTPIFYVNSAPHLGHLYTALIADASHRFQQLLGQNDTFFATGTDEHGSKIQQAAVNANMSLPDFCKRISDEYKLMFTHFDVKYSDFVRTSEDRHVLAVQHFWKELKCRGHIYKGSYAGWYCVADEAFLTESQLKVQKLSDGREINVSSESGRIVEWTEEDNYKFKLAHFKDDLLHWLKNEKTVQPLKFHKMLVRWIEEGAMDADLSISRPAKRVHWGVPVPDDADQTVYVWLDALVNYLTVVGYPGQVSKWPPVHVVGKDILKFHAIYWPCFLLASGLEPPRSVQVHSHWIIDGEKMSKSLGNVVDPMQAADKFTSSGLRYFLLREGTPHSDANFNEEKAINLMNAELADTLGNLLNRCTGKTVNALQIFPKFSAENYTRYCSSSAAILQERLTVLPDEVADHYKHFNFYRGIEEIILTLHEANRFFESNKPWELRKSKDSRDHLDIVLHIVMETLRISAIGLQPIIPELSSIILNKLGIPSNHRLWGHMKCSFAKDSTSETCEQRIIPKENVLVYKKIALKK
ncbi:methionine--tRNA ligase, mitochondrial isoform X2 [Nilaparvata lugens]|uniref:methionine--tRNA ligase, mitochondrial isoform X2 n=1 Tax=Nilaparvata lugens TaxID=108931 RepID=UPI00193D29A6|nr:methionine--tRNA ligase, mitochondrial isoform X2 [Nilaparvata lugens]